MLHAHLPRRVTARRAAAVAAAAAVALAAACGASAPVAAVPDTAGGPAPGDTATAPAPLLALAAADALPEVVVARGTPAARPSMEARAADLDGDGDLDLLVAREMGANALLLNDGTGRFVDATDARLPRIVHDHEDVAVLDVERDGDLDVVVVSEDDVPPQLGGNPPGAKQELYLNDGRGTFVDARDRIPDRPSESNAVAAGDVDGDGDADLVVSDRGRERVWVNDGRGTFRDESEARAPAVADVTQDVALGDVDGDRDLDLVVGNDQGANQLLLNDGAGRFAAAPEGRLPARATAEETRNVDLADVDGDGDLDILFSNVRMTNPGADPASRLLLNDGRGAFVDASAERLPGVAHAIDGEFVDIDRDGDPDLLTAPFPGGRYRAYFNDGGGRFREDSDRVFPGRLEGQGIEIEVADLNGDRRADVYLANFVSSPDRLLLARP